MEGDAEGLEVGNEVLPSTPPMVRMREAATAYLVILIHVLPLSPNRLVSQYDRIWLSLSCPLYVVEESGATHTESARNAQRQA